MHNMLCLVDFYHLVAQAKILVNNRQHDIAHKNAVEIHSLQAYFNFIAMFTKIMISDLSRQFLSRSQNYILRPQVGLHSLRSPDLVNQPKPDWLMEWLRIHLALLNSNKRVSLSFKQRGSRGVMVRRYSCYGNGFRFDSQLADFSFFSLLFSGLRVAFTG